jgi:hypothetical protein
MSEETYDKSGLSEKRHTEQKDDKSHTTAGGKTGDPGRTPGTAEGDRADQDKKFNEQRESVDRTENTRDQSHSS